MRSIAPFHRGGWRDIRKRGTDRRLDPRNQRDCESRRFESVQRICHCDATFRRAQSHLPPTPLMELMMAKLTLYHASPSRSSIVLWMLEELGEPYDVRLLSLSKSENRAPDYLAINPRGKVPAL